MKSTKTDKPSDAEYPCLMASKYSGSVALFTARDTGTMVHVVGTMHRLGEYSDDWDVESFTSYTGKVTLENGE